MRTRRTFEHDAALSRRLARLGDDLSADRLGHPGGVRSARPEPPPATDLTTAPWWDDHTRPAAPRRPSAPRPLPGRAARGPARGRHALRGSRSPAGLGSAQLAVVAVVVAIGLAVTCWWLVRGSAHDAPALTAGQAPGLVSISPTVESVGDARGADPSSGPTTGAAPGTVTVDVAGKVRHPGIAVLDVGARVVDALEAAGGVRPGVDLTALNLARLLIDGEQVVVGVPAPGEWPRPPRPRPETRAVRRPWSTSTPPPRASSTRCPRSVR